ncbi:hypothetical protein [Methanosarcina sp. UBA5]|uniref:hypothetical protein n=1 Tax=Methanosarcina sp. UBA5 TaxID=1915593 RepID=UPI0025DA5526|nr:hypothetical protein [Methanosarcina sp. UBA5]
MPRFKEAKKCVAVILTALPVEYLAVRDHLTDIEEKHIHKELFMNVESFQLMASYGMSR